MARRLRRVIALVLAIPLAIAAVGYLLIQFTFPVTIVRYRLSATFRLEDVTSTGSGVLQVRYQPQGCFDVCGITASVSGDAIPIDFGKELGTLWILLRPSVTTSSKQTTHSNDPAWLIPDLFGKREPGDTRAGRVRKIRNFKGLKQLNFEQLPQLLMLPNDEIPSVPWRDALGPLRAGDLRPEFVSAEIETTEDQTTRGITERLPWLIVDPNRPRPLYIGGPFREDFWRRDYDLNR
jgi:hypothetical protein